MKGIPPGSGKAGPALDGEDHSKHIDTWVNTAASHLRGQGLSECLSGLPGRNGGLSATRTVTSGMAERPGDRVVLTYPEMTTVPPPDQGL